MKQTLVILILSYGSMLWAKDENSYGWNIPGSSVNIGGYLDMSYDEKREEKFLFNDIAMIFSASEHHWNLLGEVELSHISLDGRSDNGSDIDLNVERLQLTYAFNDKQSVRVGRFNSDIGYWNQAPIPILEDTTTVPHSVGNFFPKATTGILLQQNINEENSISFTFQDNQDIAHQDNSIEINAHTALAYYGIEEDISWRISLGEYKEENHQSARYLGVGSEYEGEEFSLQAELFTQKSDSLEKKPYSGYLQSTWHFEERQDVVVRVESYKDNALDVEEQTYLLGYVYRPTSHTALKGEYVYHTKLPLNRFVYSLSVLF
jgi:hypothetical protein